MTRIRDAVLRLANNRVLNNPLTNNPVTRFAAKAVGTLLNDPNLQQWFGHGANEMANMLLHSHPAPIYARAASPSEQSEPQVYQPEEVEMTAHGPAEPAAPTVEAPQPEQSVEAPAFEPLESVLEQTMQEVEQTPELRHPEQEIQV